MNCKEIIMVVLIIVNIISVKFISATDASSDKNQF